MTLTAVAALGVGSAAMAAGGGHGGGGWVAAGAAGVAARERALPQCPEVARDL